MGIRGSNLYIIALQESSSLTPFYFMAKATPTQAWLWHRRLSHLNFDTINLLSKNDIVNALPKLKYVKDQLCSSCELCKASRSSFKTKTVPSSKGRLHLIHMDLCGPMQVESFNGNKYILLQNPRSVRHDMKIGIQDHNNEPSSSKLVLDVSPQANTTDPSLQDLELLFSPIYEEYFTIGNQSVSKYSAVSDNLQ
ncbi:retrovirus-related pol polyprotein from transposon TNT 1-94 [Tanacetum coccineum]